MVTPGHEAKRPLGRSREMAGSIGKGSAAAARGTGRFVGGTFRNLWGPLVGLALILGGAAVGVTATSFFMEFYEFDGTDPGRSKAEYMDQVQEDATPFWWIGLLLIVTGAAVIAIDIYGKHVRDGMRRER